MSTKTVLAIVLIITIIAIFYGVVSPEAVGETNSNNFPEQNAVFEVSVNKENLVKGEELMILVNWQGDLLIELGNEKKTEVCDSFCEKEFSFHPVEGVYKLKVTQNKSEKIAFETKRIIVTKAKKECVNSVAFNECSETKPFYCNNGVLEENCEKCGCNTNQYCYENKCFLIPVLPKFSDLSFPKKVLINQEFSITQELNFENIVGSARYELIIEINHEKFYKKFVATKEKMSISFEELLLPLGEYDFNVVLLGFNPIEEELLSQSGKIEVITQLPELQIPIFKSVFLEGDDIVFSWQTVENAEKYNIYKSIDANPAFISYKYFTNFSGEQNTGVIQALNTGTHFFVMTSEDYFGNESEYSEMKSITVG